MTSKENLDSTTLLSRIDEQGNLVRQLKSSSNSNKVCVSWTWVSMPICFVDI